MSLKILLWPHCKDICMRKFLSILSDGTLNEPVLGSDKNAKNVSKYIN